MNLVALTKPIDPEQRERTAEHLEELAQGVREGWIDSVLYGYLKPDKDLVCGLATVPGVSGLELAGMADWLGRWVKEEAEYDH